MLQKIKQTLKGSVFQIESMSFRKIRKWMKDTRGKILWPKNEIPTFDLCEYNL